MSVLRLVYLALFVLGTVLPYRYFLAWFQENGWSIMAMVDAWHANAATSGLVWDLTVAAVTLTLWVIVEAVSRRDYLLLLAIPATYGIGVSAGLPLYLFMRSRPAAQRA